MRDIYIVTLGGVDKSLTKSGKPRGVIIENGLLHEMSRVMLIMRFHVLILLLSLFILYAIPGHCPHRNIVTFLSALTLYTSCLCEATNCHYVWVLRRVYVISFKRIRENQESTNCYRGWGQQNRQLLIQP